MEKEGDSNKKSDDQEEQLTSPPPVEATQVPLAKAQIVNNHIGVGSNNLGLEGDKEDTLDEDSKKLEVKQNFDMSYFSLTTLTVGALLFLLEAGFTRYCRDILSF